VPTYQYACTECGHSFEQFQSFADDALTECPTCGGRLRKVFNSVGIVFKGSGFYRNDSREVGKKADAPVPSKDSKDGKGKDAAAKGSDATSGSAAGTKGDSKPAAAGSSSAGSGSSAGSSSGGSSSSAGSAA
jgi:putative FmdB family regulatory protein